LGCHGPLYCHAQWQNGHENYGAFATDHIGANYEWPEGDYARREEIFQDHVGYMQGLFWFLTHDDRIPAPILQEMSRWGLPKGRVYRDRGLAA